MSDIPTFEIDSKAQAARAGIDHWRQAVSSLFDIEPAGDHFEAAISSFAIGNVLIGQSAASAQIFRRNEAVIQRSQIDHVMVQLYLAGGFSGQAEGMPIVVDPGDICCFDLAFGFETRADDFQNITMIIPKSALQPLTTGDFFHGLVLKSGETVNLLLATHMRELLCLCPEIKSAEIGLVEQMTTELVRLCLRMPRRQFLAPDADARSVVGRAKAYIAERLGNPDLDGQMICQALGVSRATLYRHFEPLGGVASVIRNWRLSNAFGELERNGLEPLQVIARRNGFRNTGVFARAFKTRYGVSPSTFRTMRARIGERRESRDRTNGAIPPASDLTRWMQQLGRFAGFGLPA